MNELDTAYGLGYAEFFAGRAWNDNPYDPNAEPELFRDWNEGFMDADWDDR
jgi:hypothetical protein